MRDRFYSTAELARVCGVSISTIKRWTDAGLLRCVRTPGGHRKFRVQDVAEATRRLGLSAAETDAADAARVDELALLLLQGNQYGLVARLADHLRAGDGFAARRFVLDLHRHGQPLAEAGDLLRAALRHLAGAEPDRFVQHRAEQIALGAGRELLLQIPEPSRAAARALVITTPEVAPLQTILIQIALAENGWQPLDLGTELSDDLVSRGLVAENAALVVLVGAHTARPALVALCGAHGVPVLRIDRDAAIEDLETWPAAPRTEKNLI